MARTLRFCSVIAQATVGICVDSAIMPVSILAGAEGLEPSVLVLETSGLAANRRARF